MPQNRQNDYHIVNNGGLSALD